MSTVVITSTMARIGEAFADKVAGATIIPGQQRRSVGLYALTWICYLAGAIAAGLALRQAPYAMAGSALLVFVASLIAARTPPAAVPPVAPRAPLPQTSSQSRRT